MSPYQKTAEVYGYFNTLPGGIPGLSMQKIVYDEKGNVKYQFDLRSTEGNIFTISANLLRKDGLSYKLEARDTYMYLEDTIYRFEKMVEETYKKLNCIPAIQII